MSRRCGRVARTLVAILVAIASLAEVAPAAKVSEVELRGDATGARVRGLMDLLAVTPGTELALADVRKSLRNLQASGLVGRAEAFVVPGAAGESVGLVFRVSARLQAGAVTISGNDCLRDSELRAALEQREQTPLSENRILRGAYRMQDVLAEHGHLAARVVVRVDVEESAKFANVTYDVTCGEPTLVGEVVFRGEIEPIARERLLERLRMTSGKRFRRRRLSEEVDRLREWLGREGFRLAEVGLPVETHDPERRKVTLEYPVSIGPRIELRISGFEARTLRKRDLLQPLERESFDEALLLQTVAKIRSDLQSRGHYQAEVRGETVDLGDRLLVSLFIDPGAVFSLKELRFAGNRLVPTSELVERVETSPARVFPPGSGRLVDEVLEEDLDNLRAHYALEGLAEAEIGPPEVSLNEADDSIEVLIPIVEGSRRQVVEVSFSGLRGFDPASQDFAIRAGGPFHPRRVEDTVAEIRAICEDLGYLSAQVTSRVEWDTTGTLASVAIEALEGPRVTVDRIILRGNVRTTTSVLEKIIGLRPGDPISRRRLFSVQRDLYRLGIFSRVEVRLAPAMPFAGSRDVLVRVEEGRPQKGSYGIGYDSEDGVRTLLGYSHGNLFGKAVATRFDLRVSQRERQGRLLLRQPFVGKFRAPVTYSLFVVEDREESFDSERRGIQIETEHARHKSTFGVLLTLKQVQVLDPDPALEAIEIERDLQEVEIASLTPRWFTDRRDDPLVPTRGWTLSLQAEYAFPSLGGKAEFVKLFAQHTSYFDLGRLGVLAGSLRVGAIESRGSGTALDPTVPSGLDSARIPISERFFAGGRTTHRAYRRDLLGVPGETLLLVGRDDGSVRRVPIGGNGLLLANLDYRFPIAGAVGGTVFADAGNVFGRWDSIDPGELELGAGVGLRYLSPIGPLRLEVGWKLDPEPEQREAVVFLSFGNPF